MELEKANEQVGEENKQFTMSKFWSCLKLQIRSIYIHICLDWNTNLWLLWKVVYAVQITVLAMQNCLAKGQGLECGCPCSQYFTSSHPSWNPCPFSKVLVPGDTVSLFLELVLSWLMECSSIVLSCPSYCRSGTWCSSCHPVITLALIL